MSNILSQEEIEGLLSTLTEAGDGATLAGAKGSAKSNNNPSGRKSPLRNEAPFDVYDFRRPDKFSREQLRTLQMLHETFGRLAGSSLSAYLRAPVSIDLVSLEQVPYEEYMRGITNSVFTIMSLPPLSGQAVWEIEFSLVFSIIDRILGGPGKAINRSNLTDIERPLVRQTIEQLLQALKVAWEGVVMFNPGIEGMETSAQFVQIAPPNDIVVTILFEVKVGNQRGAMSLCIPYQILKPITPKLSAQKWFTTNSRKHSASSKKELSQQVKNSLVECIFELGQVRINTSEFLKLKPGDLVKLNSTTDKEIRMLVGNIPKFEGRPATNGKRICFSVTNLIEEF